MHSNYEQLPGLENIYLEDSYVLTIVARDQEVTFGLDLVLLPGHPLYQPPHKGEYHCTRRAKLRFLAASRVEWIEITIVPGFDAAREIDLGTIDVLHFDGNIYHLWGGLGEVRITSESPIVKIE